MLAMLLGVTPCVRAELTVQTVIFDADSQPPIVGGMIEEYDKDIVLNQGIIVSNDSNNVEWSEDEFINNSTFYANPILSIKDYWILDCSSFGAEQFWCYLKLLESNKTYFIRAFIKTREGDIVLGNVEKLHTQIFNRYNGRSDIANVWHAFSNTLFDLTSDEIINPNNGFYYSTNENPTKVKYQVGTGYNTCYKFATEWNYKLWYYHNETHCDKNKIVNMPIMSYSNGKLTIEKNPLDLNKDITIYYCINGDYFRPETYTDIYSGPIEINEKCSVCCYAISSDKYISFTNLFVVNEYNIIQQKCATPTIKIIDERTIKLDCETKDVKFNSQVTPLNDISISNDVIQLPNQYRISVYASKNGYEDSDVVTMDFNMYVGNKGDMNGDGQVNISDAVYLVNQILGK